MDLEDEDPFVEVTHGRRYRKYKKPRKTSNATSQTCNTELIPKLLSLDISFGDLSVPELHQLKEATEKRVLNAIKDIERGKFFEHMEEVIQGCLSELGVEGPALIPKKIVCLGLGNFSLRSTPRYQLAFLKKLEQKFHVPVEVYDPVFTPLEKEMMGETGWKFKVLEENSQGEIVVDKLTIFYMPHTPHELVNGLLYANWRKDRLKNCFIISNSFVNVVCLRNSNLPYITYASKFVSETKIVNCFDDTKVFNDLGAHIFPESKIKDITEEEWKDPSTIIYDMSDFLIKTDTKKCVINP